MPHRFRCPAPLRAAALAAAFAGLATAAHAGVPVVVSGEFGWELGTAPFFADSFFASFDADVAMATAESEFAFLLPEAAGSFTLDGGTIGATSRAAWFAYDNGYNGIDLRFTNVFQAGDELQVVLDSGRRRLFDGPTSAPVLKPFALTRQGGFVGYQNADGDYVSGSLTFGTYQAGVVPEPASVALMLAGLAVVAGAAGRFRSARVAHG
jgi:hypothetical protein